MTIETVGVVGAGTMGSGIAQVFARAGFSVRLVDLEQSMLDRARAGITKSLGKFVEKGTLTPAEHDETLSRLWMATSLDLLADARATWLRRSWKTRPRSGRCSRRWTRWPAPMTIIASNTSSISITTLAAATDVLTAWSACIS